MSGHSDDNDVPDGDKMSVELLLPDEVVKSYISRHYLLQIVLVHKEHILSRSLQCLFLKRYKFFSLVKLVVAQKVAADYPKGVFDIHYMLIVSGM